MKPPGGLLLEIDKEPMGKDDKSKPMGAEPSSEMDAALGDAFDAHESGDKQAFIDAMSAAITAKCAEMYSDPDDSSEMK